ncbi:MAG: uracil-DNA glycosylase [Candidatus Cloacimonetes bacterium HGW-Cloacimonetes-1]|nr:MAG: uracil-DNA glycosylase [Candidatus Cloacimonetes bacterium HGW-Cloacimonetes-1]
MSIRALKQHLELLQNCGISQIYRSADISRASAPPVPTVVSQNKAAQLASLAEAYAACTKCKLHEERIKLVYGDGDPNATVMVIGEGPGEQENIQGRPFVGRAGQLLDKMLLAIHIPREEAYICNIVKCRPPGNRNPEADERSSCMPYLMEQIQIVQPKVFLLLGLVAAQTLLNTKESMTVLREQSLTLFDRPAYVTYHPSALLRNPNWKRPAWEDLQRFQVHYEMLRNAR